MAKHFYYKDVTVKRNKMYGYNIQEISIYYLDKEKAPHLIDRIQYQTGGTPGAKQEILNYLTSRAFGVNKEKYFIPKKYSGKNYYDDGIYKKYIIHEMF